MNTYRSWWRHKASIFRSFRFYLTEVGGGGGGGFKLILAINTLSIFCEIPIRWIQDLTLTEPMMTKIKCWKSGCMCINSNWKYVEYCNKNAPKLFDLFFYMKQLMIWYSWPTVLKYVYKHNNSQTYALRMNRQVCTGWALGVHWVSIRCALGEH